MAYRWRIDGNPPLGQLSACSTVKNFPQTQWDGKFGGRAEAEGIPESCSANPCLVMGRADSQLEVPFLEQIWVYHLTLGVLWLVLGWICH